MDSPYRGKPPFGRTTERAFLHAVLDCDFRLADSSFVRLFRPNRGMALSGYERRRFVRAQVQVLWRPDLLDYMASWFSLEGIKGPWCVCIAGRPVAYFFDDEGVLAPDLSNAERTTLREFRFA